MTQRCGYCDEALPPVLWRCEMIEGVLACGACVDVYQAYLAYLEYAWERSRREASGGA